jgi:hypothetical protein
MRRLKALWMSLVGDGDRRVRMGRILGFVFITAGFVLMGFAWNGAASRNFIEGQFPYLISGGMMGLGLVITGATLLFLATIRAERELMTDRFDEMVTLLGRNLNRLSISSNGAGTSGLNGQVVAGANAFHRAECKVLQGKDGLATVTVEQAEAEGLSPCRVCNPPHSEKKDEQEEKAVVEDGKNDVSSNGTDRAEATAGSGAKTASGKPGR